MTYYKIITSFIMVVICSFSFVSCELFGLDFQDSYDYDYDAGMIDNHINMSTWEFIQSRTDLFSLLIEAIEYAGMESYYQEAKATYLLPTNTAFNSTTSTDLSYFETNKLTGINEETGEEEEYAPTSMRHYPVEQVKEFLLYHIVEGAWTWSNAPSSPTWYNTYASADTARVNIYILKQRDPNITFNNFDGHYKEKIVPRTSNLLSDEDSYIHVMNSWLDRPTREQLTGF